MQSQQARIIAIVKELGFDAFGAFPASALQARWEVREMCAADKCRSYNRSWSCPPACGSIEAFQELFAGYSSGLLVQTVAHMADDFDYSPIEAASTSHKERTAELAASLKAAGIKAHVLGAGACGLCSSCTYPDSPCRHPEAMQPSMEACGLLVGDVCAAAEVPYNHGPHTLAFSSCILF
jgi:predicted metal-binding protein